MKNLTKALVISSVLILFVTLIVLSPKGNEYIKWEKDMIQIGQIK